jgi:hypothetical protein
MVPDNISSGCFLQRTLIGSLNVYFTCFTTNRGVNNCFKAVVLCLTTSNKTLRHEDVWGSGCIAPRILDLGTNWGEWSVTLRSGRCSPPRGKVRRVSIG